MNKNIINFIVVLLTVVLINVIFHNLSGFQQFFIVLIVAIVSNIVIDLITKDSEKANN